MSPSLFLKLMEEGNSLYKGQSHRLSGTQGVTLSAMCGQAPVGGQVLIQPKPVLLPESISWCGGYCPSLIKTTWERKGFFQLAVCHEEIGT